MEIIFENTYLCDERIAKEYMKHKILRSPRLYVIVAMFIITAGMFSLIRRFDYAAVFGILFVAWAILTVNSYRQGVKRLTKKYEELAGDEPPIARFDFADDCFVTNTPASGAMLVPYSELRGVITSKDFIMLKARGGARYALPRSGFTKGSDTGFIEFIRMRLKHAKK